MWAFYYYLAAMLHTSVRSFQNPWFWVMCNNIVSIDDLVLGSHHLYIVLVAEEC